MVDILPPQEYVNNYKDNSELLSLKKEVEELKRMHKQKTTRLRAK